MGQYDGVSSHSVLVMDNVAVHHTELVTGLFREAGKVVLYLPPYSPDRNPIEEAFSYVKYYLKAHDELLQALPNPSVVIKAAFESITSDHCNSWITNAGYCI